MQHPRNIAAICTHTMHVQYTTHANNIAQTGTCAPTHSIINLGDPNGSMRTPNSGLSLPGKLDYHAAQSVSEKQRVDKSGQINFGGQWNLTKSDILCLAVHMYLYIVTRRRTDCSACLTGGYAWLPKLQPEAQLAKLTSNSKTGLLHYGKVSYAFLKMYRSLHKDNTRTGTDPCSADPCSTAQTCRICKNANAGFCCDAINTGGLYICFLLVFVVLCACSHNVDTHKEID